MSDHSQNNRGNRGRGRGRGGRRRGRGRGRGQEGNPLGTLFQLLNAFNAYNNPAPQARTRGRGRGRGRRQAAGGSRRKERRAHGLTMDFLQWRNANPNASLLEGKGLEMYVRARMGEARRAGNLQGDRPFIWFPSLKGMTSDELHKKLENVQPDLIKQGIREEELEVLLTWLLSSVFDVSCRPPKEDVKEDDDDDDDDDGRPGKIQKVDIPPEDLSPDVVMAS